MNTQLVCTGGRVSRYAGIALTGGLVGAYFASDWPDSTPVYEVVAHGAIAGAATAFVILTCYAFAPQALTGLGVGGAKVATDPRTQQLLQEGEAAAPALGAQGEAALAEGQQVGPTLLAEGQQVGPTLLAEGQQVGPTLAPTIIKVGLNEAKVTVSGGKAVVVTEFVQDMDAAFINSIRTAAQQQGATSIVLNTGAVRNPDLAIKLGLAAQKGRTIVGGQVKIVSKPGVLDPSFEITWDPIPNVEP